MWRNLPFVRPSSDPSGAPGQATAATDGPDARGSRTESAPTAGRVAALLVTVVLVAVSLVTPAAAQDDTETWGVARAYREFDDPPLLRDNQKEDWVTIVNSRSAELRLRVEAADHLSDPDDPSQDWGRAGDWLDLQGLDRLTVPPNSEVKVPYIVKVPSDAANGRYGAEIRFTELSAGAGEGSEYGAAADIVTAHAAIVFIEVSGEQAKRIESREQPRVRDAEEGGMWIVEVMLANTGNVRADPHVRIDVWDKLQTRILVSYWFNDTRLEPGQQGFYPFRIHEMDLPRDQYWAQVTVFLDDQLVRQSGFRTFEIVEPGALKRLASLQTIRIGDGTQLVAKEGDLVRLSVVWRNDGEIPVIGQFKGTVMRDGQLVDTLESEERELDAGQGGDLDIIYTVGEPGRYEFIGRVHYGPKVTEEKSAVLEVQPGMGAGLFWALGGVAVLALLGAVFVFLRRRGRDAPTARRAPERGRARTRTGASANARGTRTGRAAPAARAASATQGRAASKTPAQRQRPNTPPGQRRGASTVRAGPGPGRASTRPAGDRPTGGRTGSGPRRRD